MADVLQMWDGDIQTIFSIDDFIQLVDEYMGMDARRYLESYLNDSDAAWSYAEDMEKEMDGLRDHHREAIRDIREQSERLAGLISEKELNRSEISNVCGKIGILTWKEINTA